MYERYAGINNILSGGYSWVIFCDRLIHMGGLLESVRSNFEPLITPVVAKLFVIGSGKLSTNMLTQMVLRRPKGVCNTRHQRTAQTKTKKSQEVVAWAFLTEKCCSKSSMKPKP